MKVVIVGAGYVGTVSGVCLAEKDHDVVCVDINPKVVNALNDAKSHIYEEGLAELLRKVRSSNRFIATTDLTHALNQAEIVILTVGTPSKNGAIDFRFIREASRSIGNYLKNNDCYLSVVVKSTVVPGTTDTLIREEIERASGKTFPSFGLGMNPEFLREGQAIQDFTYPDRIVLGFEDHETLKRLELLYAPWNVDKVRVNTRTAEMIKYANNCLLATQISAINELANLAAVLGGIDIMDVVRGVHLDKRWNPVLSDGSRAMPDILTYLTPGCGFGGSCFPKDLQALHSQGKQYGLPMQLLNAVIGVNEVQPAKVVDMLEHEFLHLEGKLVLVLGLAFKPGTDDVRESASLKIVQGLLERGAKISVHDPIAAENFKVALGKATEGICFLDRWSDYVNQSEVIILATQWPEYRALARMDLSGKIFFDARRMFKSDELVVAGYRSIGLGRRIYQ